MRSSAVATPSRRVGVGILRDSTPRLTTSSSSGSSTTSSSPSRYYGDAPSGYTGSTLTTRVTAPTPRTAASPGRRRARGDASILRGAALVRENLIPRSPQAPTINNVAPVAPPARKQAEDLSEDDWSDPWTQQEKYSAENEEFSTSNLESGFSQPPSHDKQIHLASMALLPRDDEVVTKRAVQQPPQQQHRTVSPLNWAEFSDIELPAPQRHARRAASPTPSSDGTEGTHITSMGRNRALRFKIVTYHVQPSCEIGDDATYDGSYDSNAEEINQILPDERNDWKEEEGKQNVHSLSSPLSKQFDQLQRDPAYLHAQAAGYLWQSLAGQHVRFPPQWFEGARGPPMGTDAPWQYIARHAVHKNPVFTRLVHNRASSGRLLLHLIVRDLVTGMAVFDLAIGIYHPNARGIRIVNKPQPKDEDSRHVWMAIRKISGQVSLMDAILCRGERLEEVARESPFGRDKRSVTNVNMRAVFGEESPVHTICIQESELYEKITVAAKLDPISAKAPALLILQEFLVSA
jgi:hypothetical protein